MESAILQNRYLQEIRQAIKLLHVAIDVLITKKSLKQKVLKY